MVFAFLQQAKVPVEWEHHVISTHAVSPSGDLISQEALDSVKRNKVGLKGPFETPIGKGHRSLNLTLRKALSLYANVRPCKSIVGLKTKYDNVDLVTIRENTEGEYSGLEHEVPMPACVVWRFLHRRATFCAFGALAGRPGRRGEY